MNRVAVSVGVGVMVGVEVIVGVSVMVGVRVTVGSGVSVGSTSISSTCGAGCGTVNDCTMAPPIPPLRAMLASTSVQYSRLVNVSCSRLAVVPLYAEIVYVAD